MNPEKIRNHPFLAPLAWSFTFHLALAVLSMFVYLKNFSGDLENKTPYFKVKTVEAKSAAPRGVMNPRRFVETVKFLRGTPTGTVGGVVRDVPLDATKSQVSKKPGAGHSTALHSHDFESVMVHTEERQFKEDVLLKGRPTTDLLTQFSGRVTSGSDLNTQNVFYALHKSGGKSGSYSPGNVGMDPQEGMPGFTPSGSGTPGSGIGGEGGKDDVSADRTVGEATGKITPYESLDDFMDIEVYTYQNPGDIQKYYMINVFAKKGVKALQVMPKEILFTIDASLSISSQRLDEFKKGIRYCLMNLNQGDLFNIVAFKDKTFFFSPRSVPATPQTIKDAGRFVSSLSASERTDVYSAFDGIVKLPLERRPSNVILISDGRPTYGIVNSRDLINSITRINERKRPVFAYSGGAKVNRYLLDFIAYQNRGWAEFVREIPKIDEGLAGFYDKIRDPLFLNLRYRLSGLGEANVFPKSLPDFYRNAEFTLFGTYAGEDKFSMQLLGDIDGKTKELIFSRSLSEAKKGTADIMRGWAFNRIYYLISRVTTEGSKPELLREIDELSRRYGIVTPYSPELEKND